MRLRVRLILFQTSRVILFFGIFWTFKIHENSFCFLVDLGKIIFLCSQVDTEVNHHMSWLIYKEANIKHWHHSTSVTSYDINRILMKHYIYWNWSHYLMINTRQLMNDSIEDWSPLTREKFSSQRWSFLNRGWNEVDFTHNVRPQTKMVIQVPLHANIEFLTGTV